MMPVIGIGTAIFFVSNSLHPSTHLLHQEYPTKLQLSLIQALQLVQTHLSHSRSLNDAQIRITHLESELAHLQSIQRRQAASWGDSLGRVIKVVQEVAVGPASNKATSTDSTTGTSTEEEGEATVSTSSSTPPGSAATTRLSSSSLDSTKQQIANEADRVELGLGTLVDRVRGEFGTVDEGTGREKKSRWSSWFGGK
jgi:hypothetical protein